MPSHWTYEDQRPQGDLYQGDIIDRTGPLLDVLSSVHRHFCDVKYLGFIIVSQTCDMIMRGDSCKTKYINLAVIRSLESLMPSFLEEACGTSVPGVYYEDGRGGVKDLIHRIINQNEQALGLFYLEPDGDLKIAVESVALLRVSIALQARKHYDIIRDARLGRLKAPFRNKLGWLAGNLYSRVDTPDWPEEVGKKDADKKVDKIFKDITETLKSVWVPRSLFDRALKQQPEIVRLGNDQIRSAISAGAPDPPLDVALKRIAASSQNLLDQIVSDDLVAATKALEANRGYARLVAEALVSCVRDSLDKNTLFDVLEGLVSDDRLREGIARWMSEFTNDFRNFRGRRDYSLFDSMYTSRNLFDGKMIDFLREILLSKGVSGEQFLASEPFLQGFKPTPAMLDCAKAVLQSASVDNLGARLVSRLKNDSVFRGAFTSSG